MDAAETLIREHKKIIDWHVRRYSYGGRDADDLRQVAAVELVRAAQTYDPSRAQFATYAAHKIRGGILHYLRDCGRLIRSPRSERKPVPDAVLVDDLTAASIAADFDWDVMALRHALSRLRPEVREVIDCCYLQGMSQREVAEKLGVSQMVVSRRVARGLAMLRVFLEENEVS